MPTPDRLFEVLTWVLIVVQAGLYALIVATQEGLLPMLLAAPVMVPVGLLLLVAAVRANRRKRWVQAGMSLLLALPGLLLTLFLVV